MFFAPSTSFVGNRYLSGFPDWIRVESWRIPRAGDSVVSNTLLSAVNGYSCPSLTCIRRILKEYWVWAFKPETTTLEVSWDTLGRYISHRPSGISLYWIWYSKSEHRPETFFHWRVILSDFDETKNGVPGVMLFFRSWKCKIVVKICTVYSSHTYDIKYDNYLVMTAVIRFQPLWRLSERNNNTF